MVDETKVTETNGNNKLSPWVRPVVALCSFVVFSGLAWIVVSHILSTGGNIQWVLAIMVIFAGCFLYYFGVRSQDKMLDKLSKITGAINPKESSQTTTPAVAGKTEQESVIDIPDSSIQVPKYDYNKKEWVEPEPEQEEPIPFNKDAFMNRVDAELEADGRPRNANTIAYMASRVFNNFWEFNNATAIKEARALLVKLYHDGFVEIWGTTYQNAIAKAGTKEGCPNCPKDCRINDIDSAASFYGDQWLTSYTALMTAINEYEEFTLNSWRDILL